MIILMQCLSTGGPWPISESQHVSRVGHSLIFKCTSGPQLDIIMHKWDTERKSGGPRTSVYFENGFACRIRLRNTGQYEQPYGSAPVN